MVIVSPITLSREGHPEFRAQGRDDVGHQDPRGPVGRAQHVDLVDPPILDLHPRGRDAVETPDDRLGVVR
ncbi:MAG: hypothetical protein E6H02_04350 [Bacillati bacterium ANGP1]|uniref:Uncharacterized protein n=1 Tax=Candidatus Segetimicrobium genomatis TaxID=2569760 RepID=A0A537M0U0_9BACT|nr:MAG: hypothetical protein E6H02_04350 [Terrabacteria group bacterium ANGP1]